MKVFFHCTYRIDKDGKHIATGECTAICETNTPEDIGKFFSDWLEERRLHVAENNKVEPEHVLMTSVNCIK